MDTIDISKLNKAEVLAALYNNSKPQGMGILHFTPQDMEPKEAQELVDSGNLYFDYLGGRVMKIDLSGDELMTRGYDMDNGDGAAKKALSHLLQT